MNYPFRHAGALVLLLAACAAMAGASAQDRALPDPADAGASVPPTHYAPAMPAPPGAPATRSPAENWKALNQVVAGGDPMSLAMDMPEPKAKETVPLDPHAGHRHKEGK
jgi:hypothetical protein